MSLDKTEKKRLQGMWGGFDHILIKDKHELTVQHIVDLFLNQYNSWVDPFDPNDQVFYDNLEEVKIIVSEWAKKKVMKIKENQSEETITAEIMFKHVYYGQNSIDFGSKGTNWLPKKEIAAERRQYKPWSMQHAIVKIGNGSKAELYRQMCELLPENSVKKVFFNKWWTLTDNTNRPMLFPQIFGTGSGGKFFKQNSFGKSRPIFYDFGFVNVDLRTKTIIDLNCHNEQEFAVDRGWEFVQFESDIVVDDNLLNSIHGLFYNDETSNNE